MNPADFRLYDILVLAGQAVEEASDGCHDRARETLDDARDAASAYAASAPTEAVHAIGLILNAASPARYRTAGQSVLLRNVLTACALAVLPAMEGDRNCTVEALATVSEAAMPLTRLHAPLGVIRTEICALARTAEVTA